MNKAIVYAVPVGAAGGALLSLARLVPLVIGMSLGCVYGLIFCLVCERRANRLAGACFGVSPSRCCFGWWVRPRLDLCLCPPPQGRQCWIQYAVVSLIWLVTCYFLELHWASFLSELWRELAVMQLPSTRIELNPIT
jgi:hypothetical protein